MDVLRAARSAALSAALAACSPPATTTDATLPDAALDAARDDARPTPCASDRECSDGVFCNGVERCMPGAPGASLLGCVAASAGPCAAGQACNEAAARCEGQCPGGGDADGDGHRAASCGGDDCDDADPMRHPGRAEVCDATHDEDCDPLTVGATDADRDGTISAACCNVRAGADAVCGSDCDDANPAVNRGATEACDAIDNNCNGQVDEGVARRFYPDTDRDNYGARGGAAVMACVPPPNTAENDLDCDDARPSVNPSQPETCDGLDNNCNGTPDDGPTPALACAATYGSPPNSPFACAGGRCALGACPAPYADCNAQLSDGCETDTAVNVEHCGACGRRCGTGGVCTTVAMGGARAGQCDVVQRVRPGDGWVCAQRSSGSVVCWGANDQAQLGDATTTRRPRAVVVDGLRGAVDVGAARRWYTSLVGSEPPNAFSCARTDSLVWCWGNNLAGQVGAGLPNSPIVRATPVVDFPPSTTIDVETRMAPVLTLGLQHACAAVTQTVHIAFPPENAAVYCWGSNSHGQLGRAAGSPRTSDRAIVAWSVAPAVAIQASAGGTHTCGLAFAPGATSGAPHCWGDNRLGQLGDGTTTPRGTPRAVTGITNAVEIASGAGSSCARLADGTVRCWGSNGAGELGDGTTTNRLTPVAVVGITAADPAVQLALGAGHACARLRSGAVRCWGGNFGGQLGDGTTLQRTTAVAVSGITDATDLGLSSGVSCAVRAGGTVWCWGRSDPTVFPDGSTGAHPTPVRMDVF